MRCTGRTKNFAIFSERTQIIEVFRKPVTLRTMLIAAQRLNVWFPCDFSGMLELYVIKGTLLFCENPLLRPTAPGYKLRRYVPR